MSLIPNPPSLDTILANLPKIFDRQSIQYLFNETYLPIQMRAVKYSHKKEEDPLLMPANFQRGFDSDVELEEFLQSEESAGKYVQKGLPHKKNKNLIYVLISDKPDIYNKKYYPDPAFAEYFPNA